jgi:hypothetical protein
MTNAPNAPTGAPAATFTVDQANRMLPLVRRIAADLVDGHERWQDVVREIQRLASAPRADDVDVRIVALEREAARLATDIDYCLRELAALGVECKSVEQGLVDFPGEIDGERVCLCWRHGEPAVEWWHRPDVGFAGRRRIAAVVEAVR